MLVSGVRFLGERFGSGDGEREAWMTRHMPFEPLPASVLFGFSWEIHDWPESETAAFCPVRRCLTSKFTTPGNRDQADLLDWPLVEEEEEEETFHWN